MGACSANGSAFPPSHSHFKAGRGPHPIQRNGKVTKEKQRSLRGAQPWTAEQSYNIRVAQGCPS